MSLQRSINLAVLALGVLAGLLVFPPRRANAEDIHIAVSDFNFFPAEITIYKGDNVIWDWLEPNHSSTAYDGSWDSGILITGDYFCVEFDQPGDFPYYCIPHETIMMGVVHVRDKRRVSDLNPSIAAIAPVGGGLVCVLGISGYAWRRRRNARASG